jgi:hypothetical protein
MKFFAYVYAIVTSHTNKRVNVFRVKELLRVIGNNNIQSQGNELMPSGKF